MHRTNKPRGFFYLDHRTVDGQVGIITDTYATPGNVHDSQPFIKRLTRQLERFAGRNAVLFLSLESEYFIAGEAKIAPWPGIKPG
ncbi:hypothetical protein Ppb6_01528 [Photorhabdus australis subsp. thailandensis]|uniref:Uncharacterized protein n=1 Tax=Photorhabdus australis subsp. thailandensis TaxID=2805096 RepID=A0A1C0U5B9_9GAMM|nr:hypothetical protein Ppb6_01528 [Photorhabdus australis subsp. thailandensis]